MATQRSTARAASVAARHDRLLELFHGATSLELVPMAHGGWGYRGSLAVFRRASVVVRRGAALELELAENRRFSVTVDDAATAAKLLSGLLRRDERLQAVVP